MTKRPLHRDKHLPKPVEAPAADRIVTAQDNRPKIDRLSAEDLIVDNADLSATLRDLQSRHQKLPASPTAETSLESIEANGVVIAQFGRDVQKFLQDAEDRCKKVNEPYLAITKQVYAFFNQGLRDSATPLKTKAATLAAAFVDEKDARERARLAKEAEEKRAEEKCRLELAAQAEAQGDHTSAEVLVAQAEHSERKADIAESRAASTTSLGGFSTGTSSMSVKKVLGFDIDKDTVDLEKLRPFLAIDAIEKAVTQFNRVGGNGLNPDKTPLIKSPIKGVTFKVVASGAFRG